MNNVFDFSMGDATSAIFGMMLQGIIIGLTIGLFRSLIVGYFERKD